MRKSYHQILQDTFYTEEIVDARDVYRSSVEVNDCKDVVFAPVRLKHKPLYGSNT